MMKSILSVGNKTVKLLSTIFWMYYVQTVYRSITCLHKDRNNSIILIFTLKKKSHEENKIREENTYTSSSPFDCHSLPAN